MNDGTNTREKVSIIVPIYNVEEYIERCVNSILCQTYHNIEVLLIDDGSTDKSSEIINEYGKSDSRVKVYHKNNGGLSDARNFGLIKSSGEYVCFIDADDYIHKDFVSCLLDICISHECDIAQCSFARTSGEDTFSVVRNSSVTLLNNIQMLNNLYGENYVNTVIVCNKLYKRELFESIQFPINKIHEDEATTYKLYYNANRIGVTENVMYYYYQRPNSIMQKQFNIKKLDILWAIEQRISFYADEGLMDLFYKDCYKYLTKILKCYYEIVHSKEISDKKNIVRELRWKYFDIFLKTKGAEWTKKRWMMLTFCGFFPRLYVPILKLKEKGSLKKTHLPTYFRKE